MHSGHRREGNNTAERRMFTQKIVDSDSFLDMSLSTQALYFHLNMRADDDGFVNNPKKIQRMIGASEDDLKLLIVKRFILAFENGVIVIKHWRMHNLLRKDRHNPTQYQDEYNTLTLKENGAYTELNTSMSTTCQPNDNQLATQDSIGKGSEEKDSIYISSSSDDGRADFQAIIDSFNQICKSLPKVIKLTDKRKKLISARLADLGNDVSELFRVFETVERSDFLTGRDGKWRCNFDWIMTAEKFLKIREGCYMNRSNENTASHNDYTDTSRYVGLTMNV